MVLRSFATISVAAVCLCASPARPSLVDSTPPRTAEPRRPFGQLPTSEEFSQLARTDPVAMLEACLARYRGEVRGYRAVLLKQERIQGTLHPQERIRVAFRESPFSVLMLWEEGARRAGFGTVQGTLYVVGENQGKMIGWRPDALVKKMAVGTRDSNARAAARFSIEEFGLACGTERTLRAWISARDAGQLQWEYLGVQPVPELKNRSCHVLCRTCNPAELDGFVKDESPALTASNRGDAFRTVTIMIDSETWLQTGSKLQRADGELVASYYFQDVQLNPAFGRTQFTSDALTKE